MKFSVWLKQEENISLNESLSSEVRQTCRVRHVHKMFSGLEKTCNLCTLYMPIRSAEGVIERS